MKYVVMLIFMLMPFTALASYPNQIIQVYPQNVIKRHTVEFDADTFLGLNGYYGVMDKQKLEAIRQNQLDADSLKTLLDILKALLDKQNGGNVTPTTPVIPEPVPTPEKPKIDDLDKQVYNIFKANCANCHNDSSAGGGLKLITNTGGLYNLSGLERSYVYFRTSGGQALKDNQLELMPKGGKPLTDDEIEILKSWAVKKIKQEKGK